MANYEHSVYKIYFNKQKAEGKIKVLSDQKKKRCERLKYYNNILNVNKLISTILA